MANTLQKIYAAKAELLAAEEQKEPYEVVRERALARRGERRGFVRALERAGGTAIITEIKRASPSAGLIVRNFDPVATARVYHEAGADAISVLTENAHFLGDLSYLDQVRKVTDRPLLRKDFLWTRYHVAQSAAYGADAMLLIVTGMNDDAITECMEEARAYDLDVLVEAHDEEELNRAVGVGATFIGINNRDLRTLVTDLAVSEYLLPKVPKGIFAISESGMREAEDIVRLREAGARGFLIGEALMRAEDPRGTIEALRRGAVPV